MNAIAPATNAFRPIVQVTAGLLGSERQVSVAAAIDTTLSWLSVKQQIALPIEAARHEGFECDAPRGQTVSVEAFGGIWALRYDNPDSIVPGRRWRTEVVVGAVSALPVVGIRLSVLPGSPQIAMSKSVPRVVWDLCRQPGLSDYGQPLSDQPWQVVEAGDVRRLVRLLESPSRHRPVYLLSESANGSEGVDSAYLASRTAGLAHVARLAANQTAPFAEMVGNQLGAFNGAIRTYRPGFQCFSARFSDHPLATVDWLDRRFSTRRGFVEMLVDQSIDASVARTDLERSLPNFGAFRRTLTERRLQAARSGAATDRELLELAYLDLAELKEEKDSAEALATEMESHLDDANATISDLKADVHRLSSRVAQLEHTLSEQGREEQIVLLDSLDELGEWADRYLTGRLVLLQRAIRAARKSEYGDAKLVQRALVFLAHDYREMRVGKSTLTACNEALGKLGLQLAQVGDGAMMGQFRSDYEVEWPRGRKAWLDLHLKKGNDRDRRNCLRVYFFWDQESETVVVGHLPSHLTNDLT